MKESCGEERGDSQNKLGVKLRGCTACADYFLDSYLVFGIFPLSIITLVRDMKTFFAGVTKGSFGRHVLMTTVLVLIVCMMWRNTALAETLKTKNFVVQITRNCPEGDVVCDNVSYTGTRLKTGASIKLTGKTVYRMCADKVTPCQFIGYEFLNGDYRYLVTESGTLRVYKQKRLLVEESGSWTNQ
jgi:hypothetical protein